MGVSFTEGGGGLNNCKVELRSVQETLKRLQERINANDERERHDWASNTVRDQLEKEALWLHSRIVELESILSDYEVIKINKRATDKVAIGSIVELKYVNAPDDKRRVIEIVGHAEGDRNKLISYDTPLVKAMIGKHVGEIVTIHSGKNTITIQIVGLYTDWPKTESS